MRGGKACASLCWTLALVLAAAAAARGRQEEGGPGELDALYDKLERLERLDAAAAEVADAAGAGAGAELLAALLATAPDLVPAQLDRLLADLRAAAAPAASSAPAAPAPAPALDPHYDDDDDDWPVEGDELDEEYAGEEDEWAEDAPRSAQAQEALRLSALQHWLGVQRGAACAAPAPSAVCVQDVYPHPARLYLPPCAVLHRCAAAAACCADRRQRCAPVPAGLRVVHLPFYVLDVTATVNSGWRLPFVNHTRCACANRSAAAEVDEVAEEMLAAARDYPASAAAAATAATAAAPAATTAAPDMAGDDTTSRPATLATTPAPPPPLPPGPGTRRGCSCPRGLTAGAAPGARCWCECRDRSCASLVRGKEHFGLKDRVCIKRGVCAAPRCEFGQYSRASGRCPRRREPDRARPAPAPAA